MYRGGFCARRVRVLAGGVGGEAGDGVCAGVVYGEDRGGHYAEAGKADGPSPRRRCVTAQCMS